jgi:hypothetical protein
MLVHKSSIGSCRKIVFYVSKKIVLNNFRALFITNTIYYSVSVVIFQMHVVLATFRFNIELIIDGFYPKFSDAVQFPSLFISRMWTISALRQLRNFPIGHFLYNPEAEPKICRSKLDIFLKCI